MAHEPVDSLRVLSVIPAAAESPTTRVYAVSFEVAFHGGRSLSMENGAIVGRTLLPGTRIVTPGSFQVTAPAKCIGPTDRESVFRKMLL